MRIRNVLVALAVAALVAPVAACAAPAPQAAAPAASRTAVGQYGPVTVTGIPQRVVVPDNPSSDIALALGAPVVAQGEWGTGVAENGVPPWRKPLITGPSPQVIEYNPDGYDVEETLGLQPDLVLAGFDMSEDVYRQLSARVPVLSTSFDQSAEEIVRQIGIATGREAQAQALIDGQARSIAEARARYPQLAGKTISVLGAYEPGTLYNGGAKEVSNFWLGDVGLAPSRGMVEIGEDRTVGPEQFARFDADILFVGYGSPELQRQMESNELFRRIPAVAQGRYFGSSDGNTPEYFRAVSPAHVDYGMAQLLPGFADMVARSG